MNVSKLFFQPFAWLQQRFAMNKKSSVVKLVSQPLEWKMECWSGIMNMPYRKLLFWTIVQNTNCILKSCVLQIKIIPATYIKYRHLQKVTQFDQCPRAKQLILLEKQYNTFSNLRSLGMQFAREVRPRHLLERNIQCSGGKVGKFSNQPMLSTAMLE